MREDLTLLIVERPGRTALDHELLDSLTEPPVHTVWARSLAEGLEALRGGGVDVCLVCDPLGERDGIDFLTDAEVRASGIPVILITDRETPEVDRRAWKAGAAGYLSKDELTGPRLDRAIRYATGPRRRRPQEALGRPVVELTRPEPRREEAGPIHRAQERGESWSGELELERKDGGLPPALLTDRPAFGADGESLGMVGGSSDVSELKEIEAALQERVKELRTLYQATKLLHEPSDNIEETLQRFVETLPPGWLYPDITEVSLTFEGTRVATAGFRESPWSLGADVVTEDSSPMGRLEVVLTEERPRLDEGPFLKEERALLDTLARAVAQTLQRHRLARDTAQALARLRASEERFRLIAERIEQVFWITAPDETGTEYVSPAYESIWGRPREELLRNRGAWAQSIHHGDLDRVLEALEHQRSGDYDEEYRIVRPDGEVRWIRDRAFPVRDDQGQVLRLVGVAEDVTESKRTEERLGLLTREISDVIFILRPDGTISFATPSVTQMTGYSPAELGRMSGFEILHPEDRPRLEALFEETLATPGTSEQAQYRIVRKDGEERRIESLGRNLIDRPGVEGLLITSRDVTERVELEERMRESQRLESVGRLAGGIAHDFNNLLTVIQGQSDLLLLELEESETAVQEVEVIRAAAERAASLTNHLLAFSRDQVLQPRVVNLGVVVRRMSGLVDRVSGDDVRVILDLPEDLPPVEVDSGQLEQVVLNLAVNALDAMPNGGELRLKTLRQQVSEEAGGGGELGAGVYTVLEVSDTGVGMSDEIRSRVFEPFFTTKRSAGGTGLGLAMVYGFVRQSGGEIEIESAPGQGTTFRLFFPAVAGKVAGTDGPGVSDAVSSDVSGTVLVVEDEPAVRRLTTRLLEREGLTVLEAADAERGLELLAGDHTVDLLLTDLSLPGMSGVELDERALESRPDLPVVFMSGYATDALGLQGEIRTSAAFIQKPFDRETLLEVVHQNLRKDPD